MPSLALSLSQPSRSRSLSLSLRFRPASSPRRSNPAQRHDLDREILHLANHLHPISTPSPLHLNSTSARSPLHSSRSSPPALCLPALAKWRMRP
eukprot:5040872-Pleurochrysis_carterae.AAC.1